MLTPDETKPWFMKIRVGYSSNSQTSSDTFENGTLPISHRRKRINPGLTLWQTWPNDICVMCGIQGIQTLALRVFFAT